MYYIVPFEWMEVQHFIRASLLWCTSHSKWILVCGTQLTNWLTCSHQLSLPYISFTFWPHLSSVLSVHITFLAIPFSTPSPKPRKHVNGRNSAPHESPRVLFLHSWAPSVQTEEAIRGRRNGHFDMAIASPGQSTTTFHALSHYHHDLSTPPDYAAWLFVTYSMCWTPLQIATGVVCWLVHARALRASKKITLVSNPALDEV